MNSIEPSELIINARGAVYHLDLRPEEIADTIITVGDPFRVEKVSKYFDHIEHRSSHREFITHTGTVNGKRISVVSTGIGPDNIDIVMNELDAAVNINLETRELNPTHRTLNVIRLGTSGALQADIPVNGIVVSSHGLGLDGLLNFYDNWERVCENPISEAFIKHTGWKSNLPYPYCVKASDNLISKFQQGTHIGITATAPGFYGPQGRQIRLKAAMPNLNEFLTDFKMGEHRITNFEMETSALYGLGKLLNHNCLTACVIIANRVRKEFTNDYTKSVEILIQESLQRLTS
jgi:uridine phosphorylase